MPMGGREGSEGREGRGGKVRNGSEMKGREEKQKEGKGKIRSHIQELLYSRQEPR